MQWLVVSVVLSVVLTVVLNVGLRAFPRAGEELDRKLTQLDEDGASGVHVPWKAMLVASLVLTVGLNLVLWIVRSFSS